MRQPAPREVERPRCYGLSFAEDKTCQRCAHRDYCKSICAEWVGVPSLAQHLVQVEEGFKGKHVGVTSQHYADVGYDKREDNVVDVYCWAYKQHFGRKPRRESLESGRGLTHITSANMYCIKHSIKFSEWVAVQMYALRDHLPETWGFQPNMLRGANAEKRWQTQQEMDTRRFKKAGGTTFANKTELGSLWQELTLEEEDVGEFYVASVVRNIKVTWQEAVVFTRPSDLWRAVVEKEQARTMAGRSIYSQLSQQHSADLLEQSYALARARAYVRVAATYDPTLPERIGVSGTVTWEALAELLRKLYGDYAALEVDLQGVTGIAWRFNG